MRIVAGIAKGRKLKAPAGRTARPTSDRVREALFSSLGRQVLDAHVLDLFAGSGALGLEALSRGAGTVVFVEQQRQNAAIVRENLTALGFGGQADLMIRDFAAALKALGRGEQRFDLIFLDPPYDSDFLHRSMETIDTLDLLRAEGVVVAEHRRNLELNPPSSLLITSKKQYGDTALTFLERATPHSTSEE